MVKIYLGPILFYCVIMFVITAIYFMTISYFLHVAIILIFLYRLLTFDMPPNRPAPGGDLTAPSAGVTLYELHQHDLEELERSAAIHKSVAHHTVHWVNLHPEVLPTPSHPPEGDTVLRVEEDLSPNKRIPLVYILGGL